MEIKTENTAAGTAMPPSAGKPPDPLYVRLLRYRTSIAALHSMVKNGILKNTDFQKCCGILAEKYGLVQATLCDCTELDAQQVTLEEEMEIVSELIRQCIAENTAKAQNQAAFMEKYERHTRRYEKMKQKYTAIEAERQRRKEQYDRIAAFSKMLMEQADLPIDFSDDLWLAAVDHATINANETVTFTFKDGTEITERM